MPLDPDDRFVRSKEVRQRTGLTISTIYRLIEQERFPRQIALGSNTVAWLESELRAWMNAREQADDRKPWSPPAPPPRNTGEPVLPPLAPREKSAEAAAKVAGVVGIAASPDDPVSDVELALRFPDWPEMMRRRTAAAYLDLTESAFIREVSRRVLPYPVLLGGREAWSRQQIDRSIASLLARFR